MKAGRVLAPHSREHHWHDVTVAELRGFIALVILMGIIKKNNVKDYWNTDPVMNTPLFSKVMSVNRFLNILRALHFTDSLANYAADRREKMKKIKHVFDHLKAKFLAAFVPYQKLVIDESLVLWRGRLSFKQYIPSKRHRFGLKLFVLCDCRSGYVQDIILYTGKETYLDHEDEGLPSNVVKTLMSPYLDKNHILYVDNWYTSPLLFQYLLNQQTGACGTVRRTRKHMPPKANLAQRGQVRHLQSNQILSVVWKDKKDVNLLTTVHRPLMQASNRYDPQTRSNIQKPVCVLDYNINMRLVDKSDAMIASIECARKTLKWYKKLFFHLIDITVLNSCILFMGKTGKKVTLQSYAVEVVRELLQDNITEHSAPGRRSGEGDPDRLTARHFISTMQAPADAKKKHVQRACFVCRHTSRRPKERRDTRYHCSECDVPLCLEPCFQDYHTKARF